MEEYAPASLARDCKIYSLWEGTNFIQSQDFTGRKFTMKKGEPFAKWLGQIADYITNEKTADFAAEFDLMAEAFAAFREIVDMTNGWRGEQQRLVQLFATRTMHAGAMILGGKLILSQGVLAAKKLAELGEGHFDANFYKSKMATAKFFVMNVVPNIFGILKAMKLADTSSIDLAEECYM